LKNPEEKRTRIAFRRRIDLPLIYTGIASGDRIRTDNPHGVITELNASEFFKKPIVGQRESPDE
jgi:hypothetical protein